MRFAPSQLRDRWQEEVAADLLAMRDGVKMMVRITSDLLDLECLRLGTLVLDTKVTRVVPLLQECAHQARLAPRSTTWSAAQCADSAPCRWPS